MALNLSRKEYNRLIGKANTAPKRDHVALCDEGEEKRGEIAPATGEVTHRLKKSLRLRFDNSPVVGSFARCERIGYWWMCDVYVGCGEVRFMLSEAAFGDHFEKEQR